MCGQNMKFSLRCLLSYHIFLLRYFAVETFYFIPNLKGKCVKYTDSSSAALHLLQISRWGRNLRSGRAPPYQIHPIIHAFHKSYPNQGTSWNGYFLHGDRRLFQTRQGISSDDSCSPTNISVSNIVSKPAFKSINLKSITDLSSLLDICTKYEVSTLAPWEVALALNHLGRLVQKSSDASQEDGVKGLFQEYQRRLVQGLGGVDSKNLAWILNGAKHVVSRRMNGFDLQETKLFLRVIGSRIIEINNIDILNLSIILNALSSMAQLHEEFVPDTSLVHHLEAQTCLHSQHSYHNYSQAMSTILNSFARLGYTKSRVFPYFSKIIQNGSAPSFSILSLSLIAHAYSKISVREESERTLQEYREVMSFVSNGILRISPSAFNSHDISSLCSAFARSKIPSNKVFIHLLAAASFTRADSWGNQAIANTMNAFSAVGFNCSKFMIDMASVAISRTESHSKILPRHMAMILNALCRLEIFNEDIFRRFSVVLLQKSELQPHSTRFSVHGVRSQMEPRSSMANHEDGESRSAPLRGGGLSCREDGDAADACAWSAVEVCTVAQSYAKASTYFLSQSTSVTGIKRIVHSERRQWLMTAHFTRVSELVLNHFADISLTISQQEWLGPDGKGQAAASMINALAKLSLRHDALLQHLGGALVLGSSRDLAGVVAAGALSEWDAGMGCGDAGLEAEWSSEQRGGEGILTNMAQAVHGMASLNVEHAEFMEALSGRLCRCRPEELSGQVLANVAWSLAVLDDHLAYPKAHARMAAAIRDQFDQLLEGREITLGRSCVSGAPGASAHGAAPDSGPAASPPPGATNADGGAPGAAGVKGWGGGASPESRRRAASVVDLAEVRQVYQYMLSWRLAARQGRRGDWLDADEARMGVARSVFEGRSRNRGEASRLQRQVAETLRGMGLRVAVECVEPSSGYSVDMRFHPPPPPPALPSARAPAGAEVVLLEVDGPRHFALPEMRRPLGHTVLKRRHLQALGARVVSIPFWEWPADAALDERRAYLAARLRDAV
jgi:hypothetical protein